MSARDFRGVLDKCDTTSPYGLTGAVNTGSVTTLCEGLERLRYAAGNIYDWKTTGAVVSQQPFGGARRSGTDDKAGAKLNMYRWVSPRSISLLHNKPQVPWPAFVDLQ
jgi:1-pyrroline-5-carboxylate dehydrogenase